MAKYKLGLVSNQHSCAEVKLVKELGDKDVVFYESLCVSILGIANDIGEPLPLLLATRHPDEEHLKRRASKFVLKMLSRVPCKFQTHAMMNTLLQALLFRHLLSCTRHDFRC